MPVPLTQFRDALLDLALSFLWRQWSALGVPGYDGGEDEVAVDPEALIAFTCSMARYDARLFDEAVDWIAANDRHINAPRLKAMFAADGFSGARVLTAVARSLARSAPSLKWKPLSNLAPPLAETESLFRNRDGSPLPEAGGPDLDFIQLGLRRAPLRLRGRARRFPADLPAARMLRMRALLGVGARADILCYLGCDREGHSHAIARRLRYSQKTVYDVLADFECAGIVVSSRNGRERTYRLISRGAAGELLPPGPTHRWVEWPALLAAVEALWRGVDRAVRSGYGAPLALSEAFLLVRGLTRAVNSIEGMPGSPEPPPNKEIEAYVALGVSVVDEVLRPHILAGGWTHGPSIP